MLKQGHHQQGQREDHQQIETNKLGDGNIKPKVTPKVTEVKVTQITIGLQTIKGNQWGNHKANQWINNTS